MQTGHSPFQRDSVEIPRRQFLNATAAGLAVTGFCGAPVAVRAAGSAADSSPETLVAQIERSLTPEQRKLMSFEFDHPLRQDVDNNWHITKAVIGKDFSADQQALIRDIFRGIHSEEYEEAGFDQLHFAYYSNMDIGQDGVWDVWQIEGPATVWHFRGAPHVHTWVHIRRPNAG